MTVQSSSWGDEFYGFVLFCIGRSTDVVNIGGWAWIVLFVPNERFGCKWLRTGALLEFVSMCER